MVHYFTLILKTEEKEALEALSLRQELTVQQVIIQAIRTYQYQIHLGDNPCTSLKLYATPNENQD